MPAQPQNQNQNDNSLSALWIVVGLFVLLWFIWFYFHGPIVAFVLKIKLFEIAFISLFTDSLSQFRAQIEALPVNSVTFGQLSAISEIIGDYLKYPLGVLLLVFAVLVYFSNPIQRYKRVFNMQRLLDSEKTYWPFVTPISKIDLVNEPLNKGPWAMSIPPMDFAKQNKLVIEDQAKRRKTYGFSRTPVNITLNKGAAARVFAMQLGELWTGPENLNPYTKALFVIFLTRAMHQRKDSEFLLPQIAASTESGRLNFKGVEELLEKYKDVRLVKDIGQNHAYTMTVMATMLQLARTDGVLASAEFLWLKPVDRRLWYILNSVGRQTAVPEVAGIFAHWLVEKTFGRAVYVPMVDSAVEGLEQSLAELLYFADDDKESA